jgi:DNA polymerase-3 subunit beta
MRIECDTEKLKKAISQVERVTGKNLTLQVLNSILFIASGKFLKLRATNLSLGIEVEIPAKIESEGMMVISGSVLVNIFTNIYNIPKVILENKDGNLLIETENNKIIIKGQPHEDFPNIPKISGETFEIESQKLIEGIKSVYYSASVSDIKPEYSSVYVYFFENNLFFVSTDSFRLAEKKIKIKENIEIPGILIPFKNIPEILKIIGDLTGKISVCFNENQISFSADNIYLISRVVNGIFPDYTQIIPKEFNTKAVVLKQELLNSLKISNIFSGKFNEVNLSIRVQEKIFELSVKNSEVGEYKTCLNAEIEGEDVELSFNSKYFFDCFQVINSDRIIIKINKSNDGQLNRNKPLIISGVSDNSFLYLIMPMDK